MSNAQNTKAEPKPGEPIVSTCPVCGNLAEVWEGQFRTHGSWLACRGSGRPVPESTECRSCGEIEPCGEYGLCSRCIAGVRRNCPEARL